MENELERMALEAMDRFITTFNSRSPKEWSLSLQYPHVRVSARMDPNITMTAEEYASGIDFERLISMGWDYSQWDSKEILHLSDNKAHGAGQYSRFNAQGEKYWTNQVAYIITRVNNNWGIQARFGIDFSRKTSMDTDKVESIAAEVIQKFIKAANERDQVTQVGLINFPYLEINPGGVNRCANAEEFNMQERPPRPDANFEWYRIKPGRAKIIQKSNISANATVELSYFDAADSILLSSQAVYLLTLKEEHWGIHAVSVL